jgi:hypothetical protein
MQRTLVSGVIVVALLLSIAAWAAKPNEAESTRLKTEADGITKQVTQLQATVDKAAGETKIAGQDYVEALKAKAAAAVKYAEAKASGEDAALKTAGDVYNNAVLAAAQASDRYNIRQQQANLQPTQAQLDQYQKNPAEELKPLIAAVVEARQKAIAAGSALVTAINPNTKPETLEATRDAWMLSQDVLDVAARTLTLANNRVQLAQKSKNDPGVLAKLTELAKADAEFIAAYKAAKEQALKAKLLERKCKQLISEANALANAPKKK